MRIALDAAHGEPSDVFGPKRVRIEADAETKGGIVPEVQDWKSMINTRSLTGAGMGPNSSSRRSTVPTGFSSGWWHLTGYSLPVVLDGRSGYHGT